MSSDAMIATASAMAALERRLEVATSNLSGLQKSGYMWRQATTRAAPSAFEREMGLPATLVQTDVRPTFAPGMAVANANPLSLAIKEEGFFELKTDDGPLYTRNGDFVINKSGVLTTRQGQEVAGTSGRIQADPAGGPLSMNDRGELSQRGITVGKVKVVNFEKTSGLEPVSDTMFRASPGVTPKEVDKAEMVAGHVERPVQGVIDGLVEMVSIQRAYEAAQKAARAIDDASMNRIRQS